MPFHWTKEKKILYFAPNYDGLERPALDVHHRGTEDTEEGVFSLAGRRQPGKRASAFGENSLTWFKPLTASHQSVRSCPQGCDLLSDRRLPIGQKYSCLCALRVSVVAKMVDGTRITESSSYLPFADLFYQSEDTLFRSEAEFLTWHLSCQVAEELQNKFHCPGIPQGGK